MKFSVGYQPDELFRQSVLRHADAVRELYFPWGGFSTGRGVSAGSAFQRKLEEDLTAYSLSLIHISEPTRRQARSRMPSSA